MRFTVHTHRWSELTDVGVDPFLLVCRSGTHGRIMMSRHSSEIAPFADPYNAGADLLRYYGNRFMRRRFPEDVTVEEP